MILVCTLALLLGSHAGRSSAAGIPREVIHPMTSQAGVQVSPRLVNLGNVGHHQTRSFTFLVSNSSSAPMELAKVKSSCDCMKVQLSLAPLAPGETREGRVDIRFGRGFGNFHKYIAITPKSGRPLRVSVMARYHPGVRTSESRFYLESSTVARLPQARGVVTVSREVRRGQPLRVEKLSTDNPLLKASIERVPGDKVRLIVEVAAEHPAGSIRGNLRCEVEGLPMVIPIAGKVHRGVRVHPDHFNFSRIDDLAAAWTLVELDAVDGRQFQILELRVAPHKGLSDHAIEVTVEKKKDGKGYRLVGRPVALELDEPLARPGRLSGTVRVRTDHPECDPIEIRYFGFVAPPSPKKGKAGTPR